MVVVSNVTDSVVSENPRVGGRERERAKPLYLEGRHGGSKMVERAKLLWLEGQGGDSEIMEAVGRTHSCWMPTRRMLNDGEKAAPSGWKANMKVPRWPRGQRQSYWQVGVRPKDLLSQQVPEMQKGNTEEHICQL